MFLRLGGMGRVPITAKSLLPSPATCLLSILLTFSQSSCLYRPVSRPSRLALMRRMVLWKVSSPFVGTPLGLVRYGAAGRLFGCRWWRLWASPLPPFVSLHPRRLLTSCVGCIHRLISRVGAGWCNPQLSSLTMPVYSWIIVCTGQRQLVRTFSMVPALLRRLLLDGSLAAIISLTHWWVVLPPAATTSLCSFARRMLL
jgi:hypothetical protein